MPPGSLVRVPGRGEFFVRDTGGDGPPVLLLHGWMASADLNWWTVYDDLAARGNRVVALDHRGHGRGLRSPEPFRLEDCAHDAAAVVQQLGCGPVTAVGYSMGGPIAQLLARDHPDVVSAVVCCATAPDWREPRWVRTFWRTMAGLRLTMGLAPTSFWTAMLVAGRFPASPHRAWAAAELSRGNPVDLAEAGRELGRYDARSWLGSIDTPAAVVVTARDTQVPPHKQRELAQLLRAPTFDVAADHLAVGSHPQEFNRALRAALDVVAPISLGSPQTAAAQV
jgi:pimeloyl-ACP methyl ester carboxylesterase